ncbi:hypothetical protein [Emticicia agri]|uniref:DUF2490 domain-containing protein n=1 Tax=Emticicia agri TaxID=2492393 RepID=A0A4V1ZCR8_9BACT|nr:hypothetical protein [Emticicia agri]RYU93610.1 hypothetical protein EWM59_20980 [Emticicia agri]
MKFFKIITTLLFFIFSTQNGHSQQVDSTKTVANFSGTIGLTNNGFSIIPTFSLNNPAAIVLLSWQKKRWSFDPDIRLVPDASKGSMLFWLRYRIIEQQKFSLRVGVHPAFNFVRRKVADNGKTVEITELLRFVAGEVAPNYQISPNWSVGAVYFYGKALQKHGPQRTHVLFLNTSVSNIKISNHFRFQLVPMVYFLYPDSFKGTYLSVTGILSRKNFPFTLQSTINQTFNSDIPDNKHFMWNVMVAYNFSKNYKRI